MARLGLPDAIVSNDVYPITRNEIEAIPADDLRRTFEAIVLTPVRRTQLFLPAMKRRRKGAFVFVTSARETRPEPGFAVPTREIAIHHRRGGLFYRRLAVGTFLKGIR
jgi:3-oxoacyl-[acyl-carrier protein] reductase